MSVTKLGPSAGKHSPLKVKGGKAWRRCQAREKTRVYQISRAKENASFERDPGADSQLGREGVKTGK